MMNTVLNNVFYHFKSSKPDNEIVRKLIKIRDTMLAKYDPELHKHLINLEIGFTTFGMYE